MIAATGRRDLLRYEGERRLHLDQSHMRAVFRQRKIVLIGLQKSLPSFGILLAEEIGFADRFGRKRIFETQRGLDCEHRQEKRKAEYERSHRKARSLS